MIKVTEEMENMNNLVSGKEIELLIKILPERKLCPDDLTSELQQTLKEEIPIMLKVVQKIEGRWILCLYNHLKT